MLSRIEERKKGEKKLSTLKKLIEIHCNKILATFLFKVFHIEIKRRFIYLF